MENNEERPIQNTFKIPSFFERVYHVVMTKNTILFEPSNSERDRLAAYLVDEYIGEYRGGVPNGGKNTFYIVTPHEELHLRSQFYYLVVRNTVGYFAHDTHHDISTKGIWDSHLENFEILFFPPDRYLDLLRREFLKVSYANTIIIDADDLLFNDDIYQVFKQFIESTPQALRPRFLVMCKNYPADSSVEARGRLTELKTILDATLFVTMEAEEASI